MMLQDCLAAYYNARCHNLEDAFFKASSYFDPEGLHDLRVEIKQLRALFRLLERIAPKFKGKKNIRHFRALFKAAGDLRDIHVQQELTRKWSQEQGVFMSEYYNELKQKEFPARKKFASFAEEFDLEKEIAVNRKRMANALRDLSQKKLSERLQQRIDAKIHRILELGAQAPDEESQLHKLRIQSKETRYTLDIAKRCLPESEYWNALNDQLRALHQALGKWHDSDVAREHIVEFQQAQQAGSAIYDLLLQKMQTENTIHLKNFHNAWAEFLILLEQTGMIPPT